VSYLGLVSVVDPITAADKSIDNPYGNFKHLNDSDERANATYYPELFNGIPASVQLITPIC